MWPYVTYHHDHRYLISIIDSIAHFPFTFPTNTELAGCLHVHLHAMHVPLAVVCCLISGVLAGHVLRCVCTVHPSLHVGTPWATAKGKVFG